MHDAVVEDPADSDRYSYRLVLSLWFLATLPMILLTWVVAPSFISHSNLPAAPTYFLLSALGMLWQGALARTMPRREAPGLSREGLRRRLWLAAPSHPRTSRRSLRALFWIMPLMGVAAISLLLTNAAASATMAFRFLRDPLWSRFFPAYAKSLGLMSPELAGQWWLLAVVPVVAVAALLGEEIFFRGPLLIGVSSFRFPPLPVPETPASRTSA